MAPRKARALPLPVTLSRPSTVVPCMFLFCFHAAHHSRIDICVIKKCWGFHGLEFGGPQHWGPTGKEDGAGGRRSHPEVPVLRVSRGPRSLTPKDDIEGHEDVGGDRKQK